MHPISLQLTAVRRAVLLSLAVVVIAGGLLAAPAPPAEAAPAFPIGSISAPDPVGDSQCPAGATCSKFTITACPDGLGGSLKSKTGYYAITEPTTPARGMVVLFSGGSGTFYWSHDNVAAAQLVQDLRSDGFRVAEVRWNGAWESASAGQQAGPARMACRAATVIEHLATDVYPTMGVNPVAGACGFCIAGASGGAAEVAYALSFYGLDELIDAVIPMSGPTHAAMRRGCVVTRGYEAYRYGGDSIQQVDRPYGYLTKGTGPCAQHDPSPAWANRWDQDSVDGTLGSDFLYEGSRVHVIVGGNDPLMQNHAGDYRARLEAAGSPFVTFEVVPGMNHAVSKSAAGLAAFRRAVNVSDPTRFRACGNGIDDDGDGRTDAAGQAPDAGCSSASDASERSLGSASAECDNGANDDFDSRTDFPGDTGCTSPTDEDETSAIACDDGLDNNGDGKRDYPDDLECATATDESEGQGAVTHPLSVSTSGSGVVTSSPEGISCPSTCSAPFAAGSDVTLTAAAANGWTFGGWSGCDSVNDVRCTVTMSGSRSVSATFTELGAKTLTVASPTGGAVSSNPGGISCPGDCTEAYAHGTGVTLTAAPNSGFAFSGWTGDCAGQSGTTCSLSMDANRSAGATFTAVPPNTLTVTPPSNGRVTSSPAGIDCPSDCSEAYPPSQSVTLTATPASGYAFESWGGDCASSTTNTCTLSMSANRTASAQFRSTTPTQGTITVTKAGTGTGTLTSSPAGINCGPGCSAQSASYPSGQSVELTAAPEAGSTFVAWGGDCSGTASTCVVAATGSRNVTARFDRGATTVTDVAVSDSAFTPKTVTIAHGDTVKWTFGGTRSHRVQDNRNLGAGSAPWYDSGPKSPGESFSYSFCAAGLFPYHSPNEPVVMTATVGVAMRSSASSGSPSSTFNVSWACGAMAGYRFDVEYRFKAPGATTWGAWKSWKANETLPSGAFVPASFSGAGTYQFRSKLENATTLVQSDWSPFLQIGVS